MPRDPRNIKAGDTAISAKNWRDMASPARRVNHLTVGTGLTAFNTDGTGIGVGVNKKTPFLPHQIQRRGGKALQISPGLFTQGGVEFALTGLSVSLPAGWTANSSYMISYKVKGDIDNPTGVTTSVGIMPVDTSDNPKYFRLAKFQTGGADGGGTVRINKVYQTWQGGDIDRSSSGGQPIADGNSPFSTSRWRKTLQKNPITDDHEDEWQLYRSHTVASRRYGIPSLQNRRSTASPLSWITPDADNRVQNGVASSFGSSQGRIKSISKDIHPGSSIPSIQLWRFRNPNNASMNTSNDFRIVARHPTGIHAQSTSGEIFYPNRNNLRNWLGVFGTSGATGEISSSNVPPHGSLRFQNDAQTADANTDRSQDGRYWYAINTSNEDGGATGGQSKKDYGTSGYVFARKLHILNSSSNNFWNTTNFITTQSGQISFETSGKSGSNDLRLWANGPGAQLAIRSVGEVLTSGPNYTLITANHLVNGNQTVDDTAAGVAQGHLISLDSLFNSDEAVAHQWFFAVGGG